MVYLSRWRSNRSFVPITLSRATQAQNLLDGLIRSVNLIVGYSTILGAIVFAARANYDIELAGEIVVLLFAVIGVEAIAFRAHDGTSFAVTYGLLLAAHIQFGLSIAVLLGAISVGVDHAFRRRQPISAIERVALIATLLLCGELLATSGPVVPRLIMIGWMAAFVALLLSRNKQRDLWESIGFLVAIGWFGTVLSAEYWPINAPANALANMGPALLRSAGFMTADTAIVVILATSVAGMGAIGSLRGLILSAFFRYMALTISAFALTESWQRFGFTGLVAGLSALVTASLAVRMQKQSEESLAGTACALSSALDARDAYTKGHSDRVAAYCMAIAQHLGWSRRRRRILELAAHLHDVGKIGIPDAVLLKPGRFTDEERAIMETHAMRSWEIAYSVPELRRAANLLRHHHERLDGSGYPDALHGPDLSAGARIMAVADVYDALTSDRPYRAGMTPDAALHEITRDAGTKFDGEVVAALKDLIESDSIEGRLQFAYCLSH